MKISTEYIVGMAVTVLSNVGAQLALKKGTLQQNFFFDVTRPLESAAGIFSNGFIVLGLFCAMLSMASWIFVLSKAEVSVAFPVSTALAFIGIAFAAHFIFGETITIVRWLGLLLITGGIILASR